MENNISTLGLGFTHFHFKQSKKWNTGISNMFNRAQQSSYPNIMMWLPTKLPEQMLTPCLSAAGQCWNFLKRFFTLWILSKYCAQDQVDLSTQNTQNVLTLNTQFCYHSWKIQTTLDANSPHVWASVFTFDATNGCLGAGLWVSPYCQSLRISTNEWHHVLKIKISHHLCNRMLMYSLQCSIASAPCSSDWAGNCTLALMV